MITVTEEELSGLLLTIARLMLAVKATEARAEAAEARLTEEIPAKVD